MVRASSSRDPASTVHRARRGGAVQAAPCRERPHVERGRDVERPAERSVGGVAVARCARRRPRRQVQRPRLVAPLAVGARALERLRGAPARLRHAAGGQAGGAELDEEEGPAVEKIDR